MVCCFCKCLNAGICVVIRMAFQEDWFIWRNSQSWRHRGVDGIDTGKQVKWSLVHLSEGRLTSIWLIALTLAVPRHADGDCKGTVTDSYRSNFNWVWLGGTSSVPSIRAFRALVSPALMGAERILCGFLWGGVYFSAGEVLCTAVEKLALIIYVSTTAIEVNISKGTPMLFE